MDCLFCKIIKNQIPAPRVHEDENFICIKDIHPQAKTHLLLIPKAHTASLDSLYPQTGSAASGADLLKTATSIARNQGLLPDGFRVVINTNANGGQSVFHLHAHILGGEALKPDFGA